MDEEADKIPKRPAPGRVCQQKHGSTSDAASPVVDEFSCVLQKQIAAVTDLLTQGAYTCGLLRSSRSGDVAICSILSLPSNFNSRTASSYVVLPCGGEPFATRGRRIHVVPFIS